MSVFNQIKNILGHKINPATEETLGIIKAKTDNISVDTVSVPGALKINMVSVPDFGLRNSSASLISPATSDTLDAVQTQTAKLTFDNSGLSTTGSAPGLSSAVNVKDVAQSNTNPIAEETISLWRRMTKLMESQATVSGYADLGSGFYTPANCQKVVIDGFAGDVVTGTGISGDGVPVVTMSNDSATAVTSVTTQTSYMGWNGQQFMLAARESYSRAIRNKLVFN